MDIVIRTVDNTELDQLVEFGKTTFREAFGDQNSPSDMESYLTTHFSREQIKFELENQDSHFYFAEKEGKILGYFKLNEGAAPTEVVLDNAIELERIYVLADFYGEGVGAQLFDVALKVAREGQFRNVWLGVWEMNLRAIRFYEKQGFIAFDSHIFKLGSDLQTDILMKMIL